MHWTLTNAVGVSTLLLSALVWRVPGILLGAAFHGWLQSRWLRRAGLVSDGGSWMMATVAGCGAGLVLCAAASYPLEYVVPYDMRTVEAANGGTRIRLGLPDWWLWVAAAATTGAIGACTSAAQAWMVGVSRPVITTWVWRHTVVLTLGGLLLVCAFEIVDVAASAAAVRRLAGDWLLRRLSELGVVVTGFVTGAVLGLATGFALPRRGGDLRPS